MPSTINMFEEDAWLPPRRPPLQDGYFAIPRMSTNPILKAAYAYGPGQLLTLLPNFYPLAAAPTPTIRPPQQTHKTIVRILFPVSTGYHRRTQISVVEIVESTGLAVGTRALLRAYDPLYIRPDDLHTIALPSIFPYPKSY